MKNGILICTSGSILNQFTLNPLMKGIRIKHSPFFLIIKWYPSAVIRTSFLRFPSIRHISRNYLNLHEWHNIGYKMMPNIRKFIQNPIYTVYPVIRWRRWCQVPGLISPELATISITGCSSNSLSAPTPGQQPSRECMPPRGDPAPFARLESHIRISGQSETCYHPATHTHTTTP